MTCHVTNQINQHMAERESDLELEALRDKCDEMESERDRLQSTVAALERDNARLMKDWENEFKSRLYAWELKDSLARQVEGLKGLLERCRALAEPKDGK